MANEQVSDGLAVGYFYNFVKRIFDNLSPQSRFILNGNEVTLVKEQVSLEVVLPGDLTRDSIERGKELVFQNGEGILLTNRGRDINVFTYPWIGENDLVIIDFPTTLEVILEYFDLDSPDDPVQINEVQKELTTFRSTLQRLIDRYPITQDRVSIRTI